MYENAFSFYNQIYKKNTLVELVGGNYAIEDGLFNGAKSSLSTIQKGWLIFYGLTSNIQQLDALYKLVCNNYIHLM